MTFTDRFDVDEQLLEAFHLAALHVVLVEAAVATQVNDFTRVVDAGGRQATQGVVELRYKAHRKHTGSHRSMQTTHYVLIHVHTAVAGGRSCMHTCRRSMCTFKHFALLKYTHVKQRSTVRGIVDTIVTFMETVTQWCH